MAGTTCVSCGRENEVGARFCSGCGDSLDPQVYCPTCNHPQPLGSRFCSACGGELGARAGWRGEGDAPGAVVDGVWERAPNEFVRRVEPEDMRSMLGRRSMTVPAGSVGLVVVDGVVKELLPPGQRTTIGLIERVADFFTGRGDRTAFFLADLRPIPVPFAVRTRPDAGGEARETEVLVSLSVERGSREGLAALVATLGGRAALLASDLYAMLRPDVVRECQTLVERTTGDEPPRYDEVEAALRAGLVETVGRRYGLAVNVRVAPLTTTAALSLHLGTGAAPKTRPCSACRAELPATLTFCDTCGARQPTLLQPDRRCACGAAVPDGDGFCGGCGAAFTAASTGASPLFTQDGTQVELDIAVRVQGQSEGFSAERLAPALAAGASRHLRGTTLTELLTPGGFAALEDAARTGVAETLASLGLRLVALTVVDIRSKTSEWLLGGRADLERARAEVALGREWIASRGDELELQGLTYGLVLQQQQAARDHKLADLAQEREGQRRERGIEDEHRFRGDEAALTDRRRRQELAAGAVTLDVTDAEREAERAVALDKARRAAERTVVGEAHVDRLGEVARGQEVDQVTRTYARTVESETTDHQADLTRRIMALDAEKRRQEVALASERARRAADDEVYGATGRSDAAFADHERRVRLAEDLAAEEERRQLEKLRAMAELERQMSAQEQEHAFRMREMLKGLSTDDVIALQATELAKTEGGGAAWAAALEGRRVAEVNEARLAEQRALAAEQVALAKELAARGIDAVAEVAAGARGDTARVQVGAMDAMGRVAASRAAPERGVPLVATAGVAPQTKPCVTPGCGAALRPDARFCGTCGKPQG